MVSQSFDLSQDLIAVAGEMPHGGRGYNEQPGFILHEPMQNVYTVSRIASSEALMSSYRIPDAVKRVFMEAFTARDVAEPPWHSALRVY
jgi:hypothetical protein